jgi:hypothetical protein
MATRPLHVPPSAATFPAPGVAASIHRAITAARDTSDRVAHCMAHTGQAETPRSLDGPGRATDRRLFGRRLHIVGPDAPCPPRRVPGPRATA